MYPYFFVWLLGIVMAVCSSKCYSFNQKKISNFFAFCSLLTVLFLFYIAHGTDVYYDTLFYAKYSAIEDIETIGFFNEWLWQVINWIGNLVGLDFFVFKLLLTLTAFVLVYKSWKKYLSNYGLILVIYMSYFMFMDCIQFQNFLATIFLMIAFKYIGRKNISAITKFVICISAAAEIHSAFWVYLIYLFAFISNKKLMAKIIAIVSSIIIVITALNHNTIPVINMLMQSSVNDRLQFYGSSATRRSWVVGFAIYLVMVICVFFIQDTMKKKEQYLKKSLSQKEYEQYSDKSSFIKIIYIINLVSIIIIPFNMMITHIYRLIRNVCMIDFCIIVSCLEYMKKGTLKKYIVCIGMFAVIIVWLIFEFKYNADYKRVVIPVFTGEWNL